MAGSRPNKTTGRPAHLTIGVLGHVDHGKTSLVRALTGMETDRLREEQERGLSIVPGFAFIESEGGVIDFIDVPGHEDFIRMMISGATGIDYLLLTVAANEGIKPQTREHFNIAGLLGLDKGLVVITKSDLVTRAELDRVRDEIRDFTAGTFMQGAQITETSSSDGDSIDNLTMLLEQQLLNPADRKDIGQCYLPLDRVFTMPGFGTVATGTLRNGTLSNGQEVAIMPRGRQAHIRQLQVHNKAEETAYPGQRVAVNLRNVDRTRIARGDVLASPGYLNPARLLDVELQLLERTGPPPRFGEKVRVLFGTCEVSAGLRILGDGQVEPGSAFAAQLDCACDVVAPVGERFIVRSMSPVMTIGGGRILDNNPVKHRRSDQHAAARLSRLASGNTADVIHELIQARGARGIEMMDLSRSVNLATDELAHTLDETKVVSVGAELLLSRAIFDALCGQALSEIERFHGANPIRKGQPLALLRSRLEGNIDDVVFRFLIEYLNEHGFVRMDNDVIRLKDFDPLNSLDAKQKKIAEDIAGAFKSGGMKPLELNEILQGDPHRKRLYQFLTEIGKLVPIHSKGLNRVLVFHRQCIDEMVRDLERAYPHSTAFTVAEMRKLVDTSRKFAIPLLEYLDSTRVTIRIGDKRKLNPGNRSSSQ